MEIIDREPNFRVDTCQRVNSEKKICDVFKDYVTMLYEIFEELKKTKDVKKATANVRERNIAKKRILKKEENAGFALITGVTILGTIGFSALVFVAVKLILAG